MAIFTVGIRAGTKYHVETHNIQFDAPSFDGLLSDLNNICKEIIAANVQRLVDNGAKEFPVMLVAGYDIMGITKIFDHELTKDEFDDLKKVQVPDKPKLSEESLKNDIDYGINMLRSAISPEGEKAWITDPAIVWQYYILQKHFGIPVPKELREQANNLQK